MSITSNYVLDIKTENQNINASRVSIYPVPTVNELSIKVDNSGTQVRGSYYITAMNGRTTH